MRKSNQSADTLPCRHTLDVSAIGKAKTLLADLPAQAPQALTAAGIDPTDWDMVLRAAIESLRGTAAAFTSDKHKFIEAVLEYGKQQKVFKAWSFVGTQGRQDYRVELTDGSEVAVEAKGCPDGNNTNIWDRPSWADEFVVWFHVSPRALLIPLARGMRSGLATRLLPKMTHDHQVVDAAIFFDGRCGSQLRPCPKSHGAQGALRGNATTIVGQTGKEDILPPPCIYLMPKSYPAVPSNPKPAVRTLAQSRFSKALLALFNVPDAEQENYVHEAQIEARSSAEGLKIQVTIVSRCHADGEDRTYQGMFKRLRRE